MQKSLLLFSLLTVLLFCFSQNQPGNNPAGLKKAWLAADKIYREAELQAEKAGDNEALQLKADTTYQKALSAFTLLKPAAQEAGSDSLLFLTLLRSGFLQYYFDSSAGAKEDYLAAMALKARLPAVADSFLFIPYLYTGGIYYNQDQFDSAFNFYKKAEALYDRYATPLNESERLFNRLGVMYYETGNYRQARNYFEKAILLTNPADISLLANYKINIASILVKLEEFPAAQSVYESLLPFNVFTNEINHNLAIISLKKKDFKKAIAYLQTVNYGDHKKNIDRYYNVGVAYAGLGENDSAELYIQRAITENLRWNGHRKNIPYGLILKFQADELAEQQQYGESMERYQQAIMQFDNEFKEADPALNPEQFSGVFSYINLFNTLSAKAVVLEKAYQQEKDIALLKTSLAAYRSAFRLAAYVEKTFDSDESRLFLGKIKYTVHGHPIDISLQLYELTRETQYLEQAYWFDQRNKASLLALTIQENELKMQPGSANELLRRESSLKTAITRLSLKVPQVTDSIQLAAIYSSIRDNEIELGKLQEKLQEDPARQQKSSIEQIPTVQELQKKLDNHTAVLSFHLTENKLLIQLVTPNKFDYHATGIDSNFFRAIEEFKMKLHNTVPGLRYTGLDAATYLYKQLILPLRSKLSQVKRLIIIPDDELHYLPFEALQDENNKYLLERFSIQYQYATTLLVSNERKTGLSGTLSFAPFVVKGYTDSSGYSLTSLPASREEVAGLRGMNFIDSMATKNNFLRSVNHYRVVHLATHATINNNEPSGSFISFYPGTDDYKLYAPEIYNLRLDSTQLIILSACETGAGKLVRGEGLMSLSRAFAAAGCPNIITSLWKAEDKTTAFITRRLHYYLDKKYATDKALQQAKLDFLTNKEIDPRFKSPEYWAHLVFIGNYESSQHGSEWWWVALAIILGALGYKLIKRKA